jgi:hypothetical protein
MLLETKWLGELRLGDEHYWDWEKRTEKDALRPRRSGGFVGQRYQRKRRKGRREARLTG